MPKIFLAILCRFSIRSGIFDPFILKFISKTSIFIKRRILEACFPPPHSTFHFSFLLICFFNFVVIRTQVTQFKLGQILMLTFVIALMHTFVVISMRTRSRIDAHIQNNIKSRGVTRVTVTKRSHCGLRGDFSEVQVWASESSHLFKMIVRMWRLIWKGQKDQKLSENKLKHTKRWLF